ncbi:UNKNOWN [Stylonychia lemnae]|uniref:Protein kintoun n=1 Tax=Stylonychia lemnae TaxID=5949 RepID=A0A078A1Q8_STYLE|nr:UNKNOWN [Stylonychia lemnae]|eukprot:CDW74714.1 UNKNOWN [Stylonychia lemnae]
MNPYASDDFSRMKVKSEPKPPKPEENPDMIDHPFFEGKKLEMSKKELKAFTMAMEQPEFKTLMADYVKEISDPNNKQEYETYLRQLEESGDLPVGTKLIEPTGLYCIKTTAKKLVSDTNKQYFDQKTFINVCVHEDVEKPKKEFVQMPDGRQGNSWQLPYRVSKPRHDQDKHGNLCSTFDIVFHRDVAGFIIYDDFKRFVSDTAVEGVNRVLAEHKEKCSSDYKIMKHLQCKGGKPGLLTIKVAIENKLLQNADVNKHETKLQKDISNQTDEFKKQQQEQEALKKGQSAQLGEIDEEDVEEEEPMPKSVVQPKYKIVYSYPVDLQDSWEGFSTNEGFEIQKPVQKIPKELTVTINVPHVESMKLALLDINQTNLIFEYPNLYYLDLNLKYICDSNQGNAKFDKNKKTLTIRVPVKGLTEESQKVFEENLKKYDEMKQKKDKDIENGKQREDEEKKEDEDKKHKLDGISEATSGESNTILPNIDVIGGDILGDQYKKDDDEVDLKKLKEEALKEDQVKQDDLSKQRENFLKVYKEDQDNQDFGEDDGQLKEVRFKNTLGDEDGINSNIKITGLNDLASKPLIQEIKQNSQGNEKTSQAEQKIQENESILPQVKQQVFDWDKTERIQAKFQFFHQKEFVFINLNFKGYNKLTDVRFALSENELVLEVKYPSALWTKDNQVFQINRLCYTLHKEIDVSQSSVELLVDFIAIKLKKLDKESSWSSLGYEIKDFTIPMRGQMKSNFLKREVPQQENKSDQKDNGVKADDNENKENKQDASNMDQKDNNPQQSEDEKQAEQIHNEIKKSALQFNFMNLESSVIYKIY